MTKKYGSTANMDSGSSDNNVRKVSDFRRALPQFCVVGVKNLILIGWGFVHGYPTILIPALQAEYGNMTENDSGFNINDETISWLGSVNYLCVPLGSLTSGLLMDPLGKRRLMQFLNLPMLVSWGLFYFAKSNAHIFMGLCLSGASGGLLEAPLLIYIAETIQPEFRGMLTASGTATVLFGVFLSFIIGSILHWRTVALISAICPFFAFIAVFFVPETPYWLYSKNRIDDAHKSLQWLRGWVEYEEVEHEFQGIAQSVDDIQSQKQAKNTERKTIASRLAPFTKRGFIAPFLLIIFGFITGHFSGITPLQTFAVEILSSYHVPINEYYATIFLGAAQVMGCVLGMVLVRSLGKRRIVFLSMIGCGVCFGAVATHNFMLNGSSNIQKKPANTLNATITGLELDVIDTFNIICNNIDKEKLKERNFSGTNQNQLVEFLEICNLTEISNQHQYDQSNGNFTRFEITENRDSVEKLFQLLYAIQNIIVPILTFEKSQNATIPLDGEKIIESIDNIYSFVQNNNKQNDGYLMMEIKRISSSLKSFTEPFLDESENTSGNWLALILLLTGTLFGHSGLKLFPWMLIGETYPMDVRSAAAGLSSALAYFIGFCSNKLFLTMVTYLTLDGTFWYYSGDAIIGCIILYFVLPETENKTLEEIQTFFVKKKPIDLHQSNGNNEPKKQ